MPYLSFNTAVDFLIGVRDQNYRDIYKMAVMPSLLGLDGLDNSSLSAFRKHIQKNIRPRLLLNLSKGKLLPSEPLDTCCIFSGIMDDFTIELIKVKDKIKVQRIIVFNRPDS